MTRTRATRTRVSFAPAAAAAGLLCAVAFGFVAPSALRAAQDPASSPLGILDAVRITLAKQPDILLQAQQVEFSQGDLQAARGQFDFRVNASFTRLRDSLPYTETQQAQIAGADLSTSVTHLTSYRLGFQKQFRSGTLIAPVAEMTRQDISLAPPVSARADVAFVVAQPLLRGRGKDVVAAAERAAGHDLDASRLDLRHTITASVLQTALAYWRYSAAFRNVGILRDSEARYRKLVGEIQTLIDADNLPASSIKQVQASLSEKTSRRLVLEQQQVEARHQLGLALGLPADQIETLAHPSDALPPVPEDPASEAADPRLADLALGQRADLQAQMQRTTSAEASTTGAKGALKPRLDLILDVGYAGLDEGGAFSRYFTPFAPAGLNASASLAFEWPVANNAAAGSFARSTAVLRSREIQADDLRRTIASGVAVAASDVQLSRQRVELTRRAIALYRSAVEDERQKLQLGLSTIIDLIVTEDRLTLSLLEEVAGELAHAQALARLRFETGSLVRPDGEGYRVVLSDLMTIPRDPERVP